MPALKEGQRFERYRVIRCLGTSLSGETYEAEDIVLHRKVALKLIHPWSHLPDAARRQFFREMYGISQLNHPYIAPILDYGETNSQLYVVRRYVGIGSLLSSEGRVWYQPPFNIPDALQYGRQLAQALTHVHSHGYIHGSLTFSNILVLRGPSIEQEPNFAPFLLSDVGLTGFVRHYGQPLSTFLPITTAPEQLGKHLTPASDQFALAVIIYFWLTGRPPYLGSPEEIARLKLTGTIPSLSALNRHISLEQELIIRRALNVYPEDRYPSMQDFATALGRALQQAAPTLLQPRTPELTTNPEPAPDIPPATPQPLPVPQPTPEKATPAPEPAPQPEPAPGIPETAPQPTPHPKIEPDIPLPVPSPAPEPAPQPEPEKPTLPTPEIAPEPEPDTLPQPEPDVPQPITPSGPELPPQPQASQELVVSDQTYSDQKELQPLPRARLIVTLPEKEESQEFIIEKAETSLGRAGSSDILLDQDTLTSRHHALLTVEDGHYLLYDLRSANGVLVNGQKIPVEMGYILEDGDHISIGSYEIIFRLSTSAAENNHNHHGTFPNTALAS